MKDRAISSLIKNTIVLLNTVLLCGGIANGQIIGDTSRRQNSTEPSRKRINPEKSAKPRLEQKVRVIYTPVYRETQKLIKPTGLNLTTLPNAEISLEPMFPGKKNTKTIIASNDGTANFNELQPGRYKLSTSLKGYQTEESDITIERQRVAIIHIPLKKVTYDFSIQTNVSEGEVRFAPAKIIKENADGTLDTEETGGYCIVRIADQKAVIKELPEGVYNLDIRTPNFPEFEQELRVIEIPEDIPDSNGNDTASGSAFNIILKNTLSTGTFISLNTSDWVLPENWLNERGILKIKNAGTALPKAKTFRFYKDFEMRSTVRLTDKTLIGFVLRAKDINNYYLIQLTGSAYPEPFLISGWIVKDGKRTERVFESTIKHVLETDIKEAKPFEIFIRAENNVFKLFAVDSRGETRSLGNVEFKDNNYPIGAVGFAGFETTNSEIVNFAVCNRVCQ